MTKLIDTYVRSKSIEALQGLESCVTNMMLPRQGRAATIGMDENGHEVCSAAAGDPAYWYSCIRAPFPVPAFEGVDICEAEEAIPVCGQWL